MLSLRVPMLVAAGLLFMISVTLLGLVSHTLAYSDSSTARNSVATFSDGIIQNTFAYLPASLNSNNDWIIFAAGMGGTLDAPLISILLLKRTPIRWKTRSFHAFNAGVAALSLLRIGVAIAAIAYTAIAFRNSSNFDLNATPESGRKYPGRFTLEAFNCHLRDYALEGEAGRFSRLCTEGRAARFIVIPYLILSICLLLLSLASIRSERRSKSSSQLLSYQGGTRNNGDL